MTTDDGVNWIRNSEIARPIWTGIDNRAAAEYQLLETVILQWLVKSK